jgi:UDP-N-acetylmuramoylalanine--D-glutamate ligase
VEGESSVRFLLKIGARDVTILDRKPESQLPDEVQKFQLKKVLGSDYLDNLDTFDIIFRSPGINPNLPQLVKAQVSGTTITSQTEFFLERYKAQTIGVTGTKGKGTTSTLIYDIFKKAGKKVFLGGNIGKPPLDFVDEVDQDTIIVLELSSFQLADEKQSPHIAVVLMVTSEHLDWHQDREDYITAKSNIARFQTRGDLLVASDDFESSRQISDTSPAQKYFFSTTHSLENGAFVKDGKIVVNAKDKTTEVDVRQIKIPGRHNLQNIAAAVLVSRLSGIDEETVQKAVNEFTGLPHRLEFVRKVNEISFYNDSASTTPETAIAAIKSFTETKILILGGSSKNSDFTELGRTIIDGNVRAVFLVGQEAGRIKSAIEAAGNFQGELIEGLKDINEVVAKSQALAEKGDVVILTPACASFGMFDNYVDRGNKFKKAVQNLS